jgi:general secretion pathway protein A
VLLNNPTLDRADFTRFLAHQFGLSQEAAESKPVCLEELERALKEGLAAGVGSILVVDEAQAVSDELLEELRLLTNLETERDKLLPLVLVGQPELAARLSQPSLRHLKQRVALRCTLSALDLSETAAYIASRITVAGGRSADLFTREAVAAIHSASHGLPRAISVICDNALVTGFAAQKKPVGAAIVREVCRDFDMNGDGLDGLAPMSLTVVADPPAELAVEPPPPEPSAVAAGGGEMFGQYTQRRRFSVFGIGR